MIFAPRVPFSSFRWSYLDRQNSEIETPNSSIPAFSNYMIYPSFRAGPLIKTSSLCDTNCVATDRLINNLKMSQVVTKVRWALSFIPIFSVEGFSQLACVSVIEKSQTIDKNEMNRYFWTAKHFGINISNYKFFWPTHLLTKASKLRPVEGFYLW